MERDAGKPSVSDQLFRSIANFEDTTAKDAPAWLGGPRGMALAVVLIILSVVTGIGVWAIVLATGSRGLMYLLGSAWCLLCGATVAFWRRHRLAAHFEAAQRALDSADPHQRQHGLTQLMLNARRGRAEHWRVASALTAYLRRPPHDHPDEPGQRQLAFSMLADNTLTLVAKEKLDLSGAVLARIRAPRADLVGACLRGADLTGARLAGANLRDADLVDARLEGADLTGADVAGTILAGGGQASGFPRLS
jgi:hypothetical protein